MKYYLLILLVLCSKIIICQNQDADLLINTIYNNLVKNSGTSFHFEYVYENPSHKMNTPIIGNIALFSNNRFFIEFDRRKINMFQLYDGNSLFTVLTDDQEIQIEDLSNESELLMLNIFKDYQTHYNHSIISNNEEYTTIELTPKKYDDMLIYNNCIDSLKLPACLKLPRQCRIGLDSLKTTQLNNCISSTKQKKINIKSIQIYFNHITQQIESIQQLDQFNGKTTVNILSTEKANENLLKLDSLKYEDFEIIDLRDNN